MIALCITQLLCYCQKDNLCSLLDSGRQIFHWLKLTILRSKSPAMSSGRSAGYFTEQRLVIEPKNLVAFQ